MIEFEINTNKKQIDFEVTQGIPKYVPANFQSKTVVPTTEQQIVTADIGYDGLEQVTVEKINLSNKTITENGTYNAETDNLNGYSSVGVNVQPTLQEKTVTITENGTTEVTADSGYDGLAKVSVEANVKDNSLLNVIKGMNSYNTTNYPFELTEDMWDENSTEIPAYKYSDNKNITNFEIPSNITRLTDYAFYGCSNITKISIPNHVTYIGDSCFRDCKSVVEVSVPFVGDAPNTSRLFGYIFGAVNYGNNATYVPSSLKKIIITDSTTVMYDAFNNLKYVQKIVFSCHISQIYARGFYNDTSLQVLNLSNCQSVPILQNIDAFTNVPTSCKFIIPDELYDSWIASTNWVSLYNNGYQFIKASEYTEA